MLACGLYPFDVDKSNDLKLQERQERLDQNIKK